MTETKCRFRSRWAFAVTACLALITHHSSLITERIAAQELPRVTPPTPDFYGAAGSGVKVSWSLDRSEVPEDDEIVATLTITNVTNSRDVLRPDLRHPKLAEFHELFIITDNADPPPGERAKEVKFSYRLRPRNRDVNRVPTLVFQYYNPAAAANKQFPVTNTGRPIPIKVIAAPPKVAPTPVPLNEPEHLFAVTTGPGVLNRGFTVPRQSWLFVAVAGPLLALGWYAAWRRIYPDAARLAKLRRSRLVRRAIAAIRRADRAPEPAAHIAEAVLGFLRSCFALPDAAVTPSEISAALAELGMEPAECERVGDFFRECDAARFAPSSDNTMSLARHAEELIARLEAA